MSVRAIKWLAAAALLWLPASAGAATFVVHVFDNDFGADPTIHTGDTIRWQFDQGAHTSTAARGQIETWDSGLHFPGEGFSHTFTHAGTFGYDCTLHGFDLGNGRGGGMAGTITVVPEPGAVALLLPLGLAALRHRR